MSKTSRPPSPFNSLGAAFEQVAPKPVTVAAAAAQKDWFAPRVPLILAVGLDFGTAFTKCKSFFGLSQDGIGRRSPRGAE